MVGLHCHIHKDQVGAVRVQMSQMAGFRDSTGAILSWEAVADIGHHGFSEGMMEWLVIGISVVVEVKIVFVIFKIALADER